MFRRESSTAVEETNGLHPLIETSWNDPPPWGDALDASKRDALYRDFQPLVRSLIARYGEDPELRQDLTGEIYCRFCQLVADYDPSRGVPLKPYLVRTLSASVYSFVRSRWRRGQREIYLEPDLEAVGGTPNPSDGWDEQMVMQQVLQQLPGAIAKLSLRQRQVVIWRYYESRSFEEIAQALGIKCTTARSLLRHGITNLRKQIAVSENA